MIAIADSGSTKTLWVLSDGKGQEHTFKTIGFNPYFVTRDEVEYCMSAAFPKEVNASDVTDVYFYGSGCSSCDNYAHLQEALSTFFSKACVNIYSDMLGTARALLKHEKGVAAILGTGSNSCFYDGTEITKCPVSLGYILGDEGSGATIGKTFIKRYLEGRFDAELTKQIFKETGETVTTVLKSVYKGEHPNRYLANFTKIISKHIEHPQMQELMRQSFRDFFGNYLLIYPDYLKYRIGFCGSIAYYFSGILVEELEKLGYSRDNVFIINEVTAELLKYHLG